jgi:hypothetical protein
MTHKAPKMKLKNINKPAISDSTNKIMDVSTPLRDSRFLFSRAHAFGESPCRMIEDDHAGDELKAE